MLNICPNCHNTDYDKEVSSDKLTIKCPKCSCSWANKALPLFILTGASGIGKTKTSYDLIKNEIGFITLDSDYFTILKSETYDDWVSHINPMLELSLDLMQSGLPIIWSMTGCIDKINSSYFSKFFNGIKTIALVTSKEVLIDRMTNGRGIKDESWIKSSIEYNDFFLKHDEIGDMPYIKIDAGENDSSQRALLIKEYIKSVLKEM